MKTLLANGGGFTEEMCAEFRKIGLDPFFLPLENGEPGDGLHPANEAQHYDLDFSDVEAIVCYQFFNYNDISKFTSLRYIHTTSSGLDHMPMEYIHSHGIHLCNARGVYSETMAEFALGGVLQLYKSAPIFRTRQEAHVWERSYHMREFRNKQVCILGSGSIGTECAKRFGAMGCRCIGLCRHPNPMAEYYDDQRSIDELDSILPESDIIILSLPLTEETKYLLNAKRFSLMKHDSVLVNMARGPIVDTSALIAALKTGPLSGAVLDVFEEEPLNSASPLWDMENVILTPHNSYFGEFTMQRMFELICKDTLEWYKKEEKQ